MARKPIYHPQFFDDVAAEFDWYSARDNTLALDFTSKLDIAVAGMLMAPERRTPVDYGIRYWPLVRFPHLVLYELSPNDVLILGLMHPSQDIEKWLDRRGN
jgi:hypothetical protein